MIFSFFKFLKKSNIDFCIINGYQDIVANTNTDSDIDILFRQYDFQNIEKIIAAFCLEENFLIVQMMHHDILAKNFFLYDPQNGEYLNLDLYAELSRKQIVYFEEDDIFDTLQSYENIPILSPEKEFTNYFIKKLDKKDLQKENFKHLYVLYSEVSELCDQNIAKFFPHTNKKIIEAFTNNNFLEISKNQNMYIKDFYDIEKIDFKRKMSNILRTIKRIFNPTGLTVSFIGPDGSGKSTIIDELMCNRLPFRRKDYFHLKPIKQDSQAVTVVDDPHEKPVYTKLKSYIKLLYFIYQYNLGWIKNILKLKIKSSLIIFDRYYDDLLVDNKRYRYGGSLPMAKFARLFIPQPDIYFILTADPKVIYERKQEVPFEELERQVESYRSLADEKRYYSIDVDRTPQEIVKEITKIMMEKMNERY